MENLQTKISPMVFYGTSEFSVYVLEVFKARGILPEVIVTTPDKPQGRKLIMTPPPSKVWAEKEGVKVMQFAKLNEDAIAEIKALAPKLFIVASYGLIIPKAILDIPTEGTLNIHPSLLPLYRGASPLQSMILTDDKHTGVTIMQMDEKMDHGPIVAQKEILFTENFPPRVDELEKTLAEVGANLLVDNLEGYIGKTLELIPQDHDKATFTKKISKEDGLVNVETLTGDVAYQQYLKIQALHGWPGTYFYVEKETAEGPKKIRVVIKDASWEKDTSTLILKRVTPEGGKEMNYSDFLNGLRLKP